MSAALAIVAVSNPSPVWLRQQGTAHISLRLPVIPGSEPGGDWESIGRPPGRGEAVTGRYACGAPGSAPSLPAIVAFALNDEAVAAQYLSSQALSTTNGQFLDYYA